MAAPWSMKIMILSFPVIGGLDGRDGVDAEGEFFLDQSAGEFLRFFGGPGGDVDDDVLFHIRNHRSENKFQQVESEKQ